MAKQKDGALFWIGLLLLYALSHGLQLTYPGVFWDDFQLIGVSPSAILTSFEETGRPWLGYFHNFLLKLPHAIWIYHGLNFLLTFASVALFHQIIKSLRIFNPVIRNWLTVLVCLLPFNHARHEITMLQYTFCHFSFFLGIWASLKLKSELISRPILWICLWISFGIEAHVLFWLALCLLELSWKGFYEFLKKKSDRILIPVVFIFYHSFFLKPHGLFAGNNSPSKTSILLSPLKVAEAFYYSVVCLFTEIFKETNTLLYLPVILICVFIIQIFLKDSLLFTADDRSLSKNEIRKGWISSLILFVAAVLPFALVRKVPSFTVDWDSRYQFFLPYSVSMSLCIFAAVVSKKVKNKKLNTLVMIFFLCQIVFCNFRMDTLYLRDWYKQKAMIKAFQSEPIVRQEFLFHVLDQASALNVNDRHFRFYEYTGLSKIAFGTEEKFYENYWDHPIDKLPMILSNLNYRSLFSLSAFKEQPEIKWRLVIQKGARGDQLNSLQILKLWWAEKFSSDDFEREIEEIVKLRMISVSMPLHEKVPL